MNTPSATLSRESSVESFLESFTSAGRRVPGLPARHRLRVRRLRPALPASSAHLRAETCNWASDAETIATGRRPRDQQRIVRGMCCVSN